MSGRVKRKSLKVLEAEGLVEGDFFPTASLALKRLKREPEPTLIPVEAASKSGTNITATNFVNQVVSDKKIRKCGKTDCQSEIPICCVRASDRCCGSSYTPRWYHLTLGEHFCNECFEYFYRSSKPGHKEYCKWRDDWSSNGKTEPTMRCFMTDQHLPYWVQCRKPGCTKWRQVPKDTIVNENFIHNYYCGKRTSGKKDIADACSVAEDNRVAQALVPSWIQTAVQPPLLKHSPAADFLVSYYPDGVGMSATASVMPIITDADDSCRTPENIWKLYHPAGVNISYQPFYQPGEQAKALSVRPDIMEYDEIQEFPEYVREQAMYLGIRNLVLALWYRNPKVWLTPEKCSDSLICRGLIRIRCIQEMCRVLEFLTRKGIVNFGILKNPPPFAILPPSFKDVEFLIIGAGTAGLAAARQLANFGGKVTVLEARDRTGGRVIDDTILGSCTGLGPQILNGCVNNPIVIMCEQAGTEVQMLADKCELIDERGNLVDHESEKRVNFHFNAVLDAVAEWRKGKGLKDDMNLYEKFLEMHKNFTEETDLKFTETEEKILQFHICNLEYACGCSLNEASSINWDQNENFAQFNGFHAWLPQGYFTLLNKLADGLDIKFNTEVSSIDYSGDNVIVHSTTGEMFNAKKVLVTLPLSILQAGTVKFKPEFPKDKEKALSHLGAGVIEKVLLKFPTRFWEKKIVSFQFFGHVPASEEERGLFNVFYTFLTNKDAEGGILMSHVSGSAVNLVKEKDDKDIVSLATNILRKLFPEENVPEPEASFVTNWRNDEYARMAFSYIMTGGQGEAYDVLAEDVQKKLFFAGEATNRHFPQTVTGAYLSGIREVAKMA